MNNIPDWIAKTTLKVDPDLVPLVGIKNQDMRHYLTDLIAWNANIRDYAGAARQYLSAENFFKAASCIEKIKQESTQMQLTEALQEAGEVWQNKVETAIREGQNSIQQFEEEGCSPNIIKETQAPLKEIRSLYDQFPLTWDNPTQIKHLDISQFQAIQEGIEYLSIATDDGRQVLQQKAKQRSEKLEALRQRSGQLIGELLSQPGCNAECREWAIEVQQNIMRQIQQEELPSAEQNLVRLEKAVNPDFQQEVAKVPTNLSACARKLSTRANTELKHRPTEPPPEAYPKELDNPPGWEWDDEPLKQIRHLAHRVTSSDIIKHSDRGLGAFLTTLAKQFLRNKEPGLALTLFRDAYEWASQPPTSFQGAVRWRQDCAWGILLSIALPSCEDQDRVVSSKNLAALFQLDIGELPLTIIEEQKLLPDLAHTLLLMDGKATQCFLREHLWTYLQDHPVALHDLIRGFALDLPNKTAQVLDVIGYLLSQFDPSLDMEAFRMLAPQAEDTTDAHLLHSVVDQALRLLQKSAEHSDLAEAAKEGLTSRPLNMERSEPRITVKLVGGSDGHCSRSRIVLRLSYTKGDEILRGVQMIPCLETEQGVPLEGIHQPILVGRLIPGSQIEIAVNYETKVDLSKAKYVTTRLERLAIEGVLVPIEIFGKQQRFSIEKKPPSDDVLLSNPYVVGKAIKERKGIYGRDGQIDDIVRRLVGESQDNVVLVLGERRIGKTTVLNGLRRHPEIKQRYICVYTDMESAGDFQTSLTFYHSYLIEPICTALKSAGLTMKWETEKSQKPDIDSPHKAFERFMAKVDQILLPCDQRLLVILDEMEKLLEQEGQETVGIKLPEEVIASIRAVLLESQRISFVLAGITDVVRRHIISPSNRLFNIALQVELTTLAPEAAKDLITEPVKSRYDVTQNAQRELITETNGHPYLIQKICHELFLLMSREGNHIVTTDDVTRILNQSILPQTQPFAYLVETVRETYDMAIFDALAVLQSEERYVSIKDLSIQLRRKGFECEEQSLVSRLDKLCLQAPSLLQRARNNHFRYRIAIRLFARHRKCLQLRRHTLVSV